MPHRAELAEEDLKACRAVADLLYKEKHRTGMTQKVLATMVGASPKTISAIVTGRMRVSTQLAIQLADIFEVHPGDIIPALKNISSNEPNAALLADLERLNPENLDTARKMIRRLLDSQAD